VCSGGQKAVKQLHPETVHDLFPQIFKNFQRQLIIQADRTREDRGYSSCLFGLGCSEFRFIRLIRTFMKKGEIEA
jgi:hypothetical protein